MSAHLTDQFSIDSSRKLPPTDRDFEIYDAVHIDCHSTRCLAEKHQISQTRVRQVIRRVVQWLSEVIPPQTKVAKEQEIHLARQIAADRFQRQLEEATEAWQSTQELKYAGLRIRLTTAQARLGAVSGLLGGLAADAIEGLPVPAYQPPANLEAWDKAAGNVAEQWPSADDPPALTPDAEPDPYSDVPVRPSLLPPPNVPKDRRRRAKLLPLALLDPINFTDITPEIIAARAAWGCPFSPRAIECIEQFWRKQAAATQPADTVGCESPDLAPSPTEGLPAVHSSPAQSAICNPQSEIPSPPPFEDCSRSADPSAECHAPALTFIVENPSPPTTSNTESEMQHIPSTSQSTPSQSLLTAAQLLGGSATQPTCPT